MIVPHYRNIVRLGTRIPFRNGSRPSQVRPLQLEHDTRGLPGVQPRGQRPEPVLQEGLRQVGVRPQDREVDRRPDHR